MLLLLDKKYIYFNLSLKKASFTSYILTCHI